MHVRAWVNRCRRNLFVRCFLVHGTLFGGHVYRSFVCQFLRFIRLGIQICWLGTVYAVLIAIPVYATGTQLAILPIMQASTYARAHASMHAHTQSSRVLAQSPTAKDPPKLTITSKLRTKQNQFYTPCHPVKLMLVIRNGKGRPEVGFGLARARKQPRNGICRCPSTRNGPLIDPRCCNTSVAIAHVAAFAMAPAVAKSWLY